MNTSQSKQFDVIDHLIFSEGLRLQAVDIQPDLDLMTIYLNTKATLSHQLSSSKLLKGADRSKLMKYELIGGGTGIHWPLLDEDLSLKGFLEDELRKVVKRRNQPLAA
ncbi:DUF2442 domain-containing protein [Paraflavitalea pollutisoli]|uniref:DUF2442 domain-containing protein n=1 Tax=Paraflavitalea pollutisoli TaxID=3034143 RepID=UPI0023EAA12E|nr:DUF2442 domain-containing protein [Paraflavitalea sp. H1-2-19X]